jgi:hypothetical protein
VIPSESPEQYPSEGFREIEEEAISDGELTSRIEKQPHYCLSLERCMLFSREMIKAKCNDRGKKFLQMKTGYHPICKDMASQHSEANFDRHSSIFSSVSDKRKQEDVHIRRLKPTPNFGLKHLPTARDLVDRIVIVGEASMTRWRTTRCQIDDPYGAIAIA